MKSKQTTKIQTLYSLVAIFLIFPVFLGVGVLLMHNNALDINGEDALWNLSGVDFNETVVRLQGDVAYIPNKVIAPEVFDDFETEILFGDTGGLDLVTSRMRIYLPDDGWYMFSRLSLGYAHRLYVNGEWLQDVGIPGENRETTRPDIGNIIFTARPVDGVIEIVQQSMTFQHRWDTLHQYWYVGNQNLITNLRSMDFLASLVIGCFLALFLIHAVLYLLQRNYKANLYLSLLSLVLLLRTGVLEPSMFSAIMPWLDWYVKFRIEYIAVPVIGWLLVFVVKELFPDVLSKYFCPAISIGTLLFTALFIFVDTTVMSQVMIWCHIFYLLAIIYALPVGIFNVTRNSRKIKLEQGILIIGFVLVSLAILYDLYRHSHLQMIPAVARLPLVSTMTRVYFCFCMAVAVFIANKRDADETKAAEQQLAVEVESLARLNTIKTELMETISHEARTPLAVLASYSGLVALELKNRNGNEQTVANLDKIVEEAKRVANLIDSMNKLTLNKEKAEKRVNLNLGELIEQTAKLYHHIFERNEIEMELDLDDRLFVLGNPEELTQVLFNLLQNAKDHTEHGKISITAKKENDQIVIIVADTGAGISSELMPYLFERGISGTEFGMGIGLAVCKEIIDAHNGTITAESESTGINRGTRFIITLPTVREEDESGTV